MSDEEPIPAATVLLVRDKPDFEVLMIRRHDDIGFAGGALVFPGGRVDPGDGDPSWADHADGLDATNAAAQIAAIREAFEEAGILLARAEGGDALIDGARASALGGWRQKVEADDTLFLEMVRVEKLRLACDRLCLFAHWVAPPGLHRRFDTLFYLAACPPGQAAREDGNEATEAIWTDPADVIAARNRGERKIIFPTMRNLELLGLSASFAEAMASARTRLIEAIQPSVMTEDGVKYLAIPESYGYPVTRERLDIATRI